MNLINPVSLKDPFLITAFCQKDMLNLFLQWWQRIDVLINQSRKIFPLKMRKTGIDMKRPGVMLVDYDNKEVKFFLSISLFA